MHLYPATGAYTLTADALPVATGKLTSGAGIPDRISIASTSAGATFALDDVLISPACCPC